MDVREFFIQWLENHEQSKDNEKENLVIPCIAGFIPVVFHPGYGGYQEPVLNVGCKWKSQSKQIQNKQIQSNIDLERSSLPVVISVITQYRLTHDYKNRKLADHTMKDGSFQKQYLDVQWIPFSCFSGYYMQEYDGSEGISFDHAKCVYAIQTQFFTHRNNFTYDKTQESSKTVDYLETVAKIGAWAMSPNPGIVRFPKEISHIIFELLGDNYNHPVDPKGNSFCPVDFNLNPDDDYQFFKCL